MTLPVSLNGSTLFVEMPGRPTAELVPYKGTEFTLKGREGTSVKFVLEKDAVTGIVISTQSGTMRGKRK